MYKSCWILMNFCPPLIWPFKLEIMIQNGEEKVRGKEGKENDNEKHNLTVF